MRTAISPRLAIRTFFIANLGAGLGANLGTGLGTNLGAGLGKRAPAQPADGCSSSKGPIGLNRSHAPTGIWPARSRW
ncbi:hypothetical protein F1599_17695 [Cupriavidus cauae]|uniref:Uncharacterized protein n=1 Tax=Cupriavidus cauae TaxID=2608999 RepID=A0A5M8AFG4_9BURK|nr:hypothetical protein F1599_17695 [Cupriavidus cauae]